MSAADTPNIITAERVDARTQSGMLRAIIRLLIVVGFGIIIILFILPFALLFRTENLGLPPGTDWVVRLGMWRAFLPEGALLACGALVAIVVLFYALRKLEPILDANASAQTQFLDTLDPRYVDVAIAFAAALSLFLELAMIRWQSSVLEFLAFYKNFSLLACFAGLGLGYALAARNRIPLLIVIPLLAGQFCFIMFTRMVPGFFNVIPFREQLSMGMQQGALPQAIILFLLLSIIFLLTALTFLPIGQLCGRLMDRRRNLRAYGLNGRALAVLRPVPAGGIATGRGEEALRVRARQHVVHVDRVAAAADHLTLLGQSRLLGDIVRIRVEILHALRHHCALGVLPWALADAVARVDASGASRFGRAQIGAPVGAG
jgi:hypothetical protein